MARAIVIGTGAGGLTAAAYLARSGVEVVALEQAKQLGGYLNPFARRHFHFDPGVHYVGQCAAGRPTALALEALGIDVNEVFAEMDPDGFDVVRFPGMEVRFCRGLDAFFERLVAHFPEDHAELERFFGLLRRADAFINSLMRFAVRPLAWQDLAGLSGIPFIARWGDASFAELLAHSFKNPQLRAMIAAQAGDYGLPPSRTPAPLGVGVLLHFVAGAHFPRGGSGGLRDALVRVAKAHGATFRRRTTVEKIRLHNGRAVGVTLAGGEQIDADVVVSGVDPQITFGRLLAESDLSETTRTVLERTEPSVASFCLFLGMHKNLRQHGLSAANVWDYPSWDLEGLYEGICRGEMPQDPFFFLSPNSLKDDSGAMAPEGCSTLEVVTLMPYGPFAQWDGLRSMRRGDDYEQYKSQVADQLLAAVERRWPGLVSDVVVKDVATPVTNTHFTAAVRGAAYGPVAKRARMGARDYRPWTDIPGLYLAGAAVFGGGVSPSIVSGISAGRLAHRFAGKHPSMQATERRHTSSGASVHAS